MSKNIFNNTLINSTNIDPVYSSLTALSALNTATITTIQSVALETSIGLASEITNRSNADTITNTNVANDFKFSFFKWVVLSCIFRI